MNGAEQLEIAEKLRLALEQAGIRVEKRLMANGRVTGHEDVPAVIVLGAIIARGWVVSLGEPPERPPLHLMRPDGHRDGREL